MTLRRNVLIFHQGALGDFVLTWPLALAAGRLLAQSRVIYVTNSQKGALAERAIRVEATDVESGWHQLFSDSPQLPERAAKMLAGAQVIFSFVAQPDDTWSRNVKQIAPEAQLVCLQSKPADDSDIHVTQHLLNQLNVIPPVQAAMAQILRSIAERGVNGIRENLAGPIIIHPGSGAARKCWPAEKFVELAEKLKSAGHTVRFLLGEVELEQWPSAQIEGVKQIAELATPKTYLDLHHEIQSAHTFVGNDTGPTHLAAMSGVRTVALFGADPARWGPIGPRVSVVSGASIEAIDIDTVMSHMTAFR